MSTAIRQDIAAHLIDLETQAMQRWCNGDPSGFLEISADTVTYFDPFQQRRVDGWKALEGLYESLRGRIFAQRFELLNPLVQSAGEAAILSYNFVSYTADGNIHRWNCTEVFRHDNGEWKIIHTHWSPAHADEN